MQNIFDVHGQGSQELVPTIIGEDTAEVELAQQVLHELLLFAV